MQKINIVRKELHRIEKKYGIISPETVVDAARDLNSPLHKYFTWDDSKAAEEYRLWQARQLVTSVTLVVRGKKQQAYYNVKIITNKKSQQGYVSMAKVLSDKDMHQYAIREALKELNYWQGKYNNLSELKSVINKEEIDKILQMLE